MAALIDGLKVVWVEEDRIFLCQGNGYSFMAWFAGTPSTVEDFQGFKSTSRMHWNIGYASSKLAKLTPN